MITFNIELGKENKKGQKKVYIVVRKDREKKSIPTVFYAERKDVSKNGELVNNLMLLSIGRQTDMMRQRLLSLGAYADRVDVDKLVELITKDEEKENAFELDFFDYGYRHVRKLMDADRESTARCYRSALSSFAKFLKRDSIDINDITKDMITRYRDWFVENNVGTRAMELYMSNLQALHNMAKDEFNDEDSDRIVIRRSPFAKVKFKRSRAEVREVADKAITAKGIKAIYDLPYMDSERAMRGADLMRVNIAKDAFLLSFGLCGINAKDLYEIESVGEDGKVRFYRSKTKRRSGADSYSEVTVPSEIKAISERNRGRRHAWRWAELYSSSSNFNSALRHGLNELVEYAVRYYGKSAEELGLLPEGRGLTFGSARSSWATIAANDCGVSTEIVDKCLCHVIDSVAAQSYIHKDYSFVDEANGKVMEYVMGLPETKKADKDAGLD